MLQNTAGVVHTSVTHDCIRAAGSGGLRKALVSVVVLRTRFVEWVGRTSWVSEPRPTLGRSRKPHMLADVGAAGTGSGTEPLCKN